MTAVDVMAALEPLGIRWRVTENGKLWLEPASVISPDLVTGVRRHNQAILDLLKRPVG